MQAGLAHRGVVPFENSSNGSVVFTLDLFSDQKDKYPDILVCGEAFVAVQHCLVGHKNGEQPVIAQNLAGEATTGAGKEKETERAAGKAAAAGPTTATKLPPLSIAIGIIDSPPSSGAATPTPAIPHPQKPTATPLAPLSRIKKLYSHPQAWGQCNAFLNTYLKGIERQDVSSTSRAAELVSQDEPGTTAAVSSSLAAEEFGLDVLARGIEDRGDNTTRFFVIRKRVLEDGGVCCSDESGNMKDGKSTLQFQDEKRGVQQESEKSGGEAENEAYKTLISFTVDHGNPGALAQSLSVFQRHGLNLTSINTRPSGVENWNYIFFVEVRGRRDGKEGAVDRALGELGDVCRGWRWLGSWRDGMPRKE